MQPTVKPSPNIGNGYIMTAFFDPFTNTSNRNIWPRQSKKMNVYPKALTFGVTQ